MAYAFYKWALDILNVPEATKMAEACTVFLVIIIAASVFVDYTYSKAGKRKGGHTKSKSRHQNNTKKW
jgi:hypothetical protein